MKKIILLNAPPNAGKDYAASYFANKYEGVKTDKFARVLKERTHAVYGFSWRPHDYYEAVKDRPNKDFFGLTPRQAYINLSETYFKVHHGKDILGFLLCKELDKYDWDINIISDLGFEHEAEVLVNRYGKENVILVRINREGCDFTNDSRNYIYLAKDICNINITNNGTEDYLVILDQLIQSIINN